MASRGSHFNEIIFLYQPEGLYFQIKKKKFEKIFSSFLKAFCKKKVYGGPYISTRRSDYISIRDKAFDFWVMVMFLARVYQSYCAFRIGILL